MENHSWEFASLPPSTTTTTTTTTTTSITTPATTAAAATATSTTAATLFSSIVTLYILILLYLPQLFLKIINLSPVFISTLILLLSLLRLGSSHQIKPFKFNHPTWVQTRPSIEPNPELKPEPESQDPARAQTGPNPNEKSELLHCNRVKTQTPTEPDPGPMPEPRSHNPVIAEMGPNPKEDSELLHFNRLNTQTSTEPNRELMPESGALHPVRAEVGPDPNEKSELLHCKRLKTPPSTKPDPEPMSERGSHDPGRAESGPTPKEEESELQHFNRVKTRPEPGSVRVPKTFYKGMVMEWDVSAPLEVIYEAYEGEEEEDETQNDAFLDYDTAKIERYPWNYQESDTDSCSSSSNGDFEAIERWKEEREGMIEIALDHGNNEGLKLEEMVQFDEEDNLIEIDLSPTIMRNSIF